ncbi:hypothetical protein JTB14_007200 [Gonioctena quinquepunctata]|nr:hypothetical protein JTB14_007200 [Gonioctena quinquepunctata]
MEGILQNNFSSSQILTYIQQATAGQRVSPEEKVVVKQEMSDEEIGKHNTVSKKIEMEPEEVIASSAKKLSKIDISTRNMLPGESSLKSQCLINNEKILGTWAEGFPT